MLITYSMTARRISLGAIAVSILIFGAHIALAQEATSSAEKKFSKVIFPIEELGNCESKEACRIYCADLTHADMCLAYAESHGLMKKDEIGRARVIITTVGPGGCTSRELCKIYCDIDANRDECRTFAVENGLQPPRIMKNGNTPAQLRGKIDLILASSSGPGGCASVSECKIFCANADHATECIAFAETHNLMTSTEAERARQFSQNVGPSGCRGAECREYCADSSHAQECLEFANTHGIMTADKMQAAMRILREGGPGGCKSAQECRAYCADAAHVDECTAFAQSHGFLRQREEQRIQSATTSRPLPPLQRIGNSVTQIVNGPGGCDSPQECVEYCRTHLEECQNFRPTPTVLPPQPTEMPIEERCKLAGGVWDGARCVRPIMQNGESPLPPARRDAPQSYVASPFVAAIATLVTPLFR